MRQIYFVFLQFPTKFMSLKFFGLVKGCHILPYFLKSISIKLFESICSFSTMLSKTTESTDKINYIYVDGNGLILFQTATFCISFTSPNLKHLQDYILI